MTRVFILIGQSMVAWHITWPRYYSRDVNKCIRFKTHHNHFWTAFYLITYFHPFIRFSHWDLNCFRRPFSMLAKIDQVRACFATKHTTYSRNSMGRKCEGNCGLWFLNTTIKKPRKCEKKLGSPLGVTCWRAQPI